MTTRLLLVCAKQISISGNLEFNDLIEGFSRRMELYANQTGHSWSWHGSMDAYMNGLDMTHGGSDLDVVIYMDISGGYHDVSVTCQHLRHLGFENIRYKHNMLCMTFTQGDFTVKVELTCTCMGSGYNDFVFMHQTYTNFFYSARYKDFVPTYYQNAVDFHDVAACMWKLMRSLGSDQLAISSMPLVLLLQGACKQVDNRLKDQTDKLPYLASHMVQMANALKNNRASRYLGEKSVKDLTLWDSGELLNILSPKQWSQIQMFSGTWGSVFMKLGLLNDDFSANMKNKDNYLLLKLAMMHGAFRCKGMVSLVDISHGALDDVYIDSLYASSYWRVQDVAKEVELMKVLLSKSGFEEDHYKKMKKTLFGRMCVQFNRAMGNDDVLYFVPEALHDDAELLGIKLSDDSD